MDLSEAEVVVTTKQEIDNDIHGGDWFHLSDYGDIGEFYQACLSYFPGEKNPQFLYPAWENIPDVLINKKWFCPNFFEIRDALERLDEQETGSFMTWCDCHGHNIATDDAHLLVTRYQDNHTSYPEFDCGENEMPDDALEYQGIISNFFDMERYATEVFGDNYD